MMKTSKDTDAIGEHQVEQGVRETGNERTVDVLVGHRTGEWVLADEADDKLKRVEEPRAEAGHLCLVPHLCLEDVLTCEIAEDDGKAHRRRLRALRTSDQGLSAPGWASRSARRRSSSAFCFLVTRTAADSATTLSQIS